MLKFIGIKIDWTEFFCFVLMSVDLIYKWSAIIAKICTERITLSLKVSGAQKSQDFWSRDDDMRLRPYFSKTSAVKKKRFSQFFWECLTINRLFWGKIAFFWRALYKISSYWQQSVFKKIERSVSKKGCSKKYQSTKKYLIPNGVWRRLLVFNINKVE